MKIRKELWFGFILVAAILIPTFIFLPAPWNMDPDSMPNATPGMNRQVMVK